MNGSLVNGDAHSIDSEDTPASVSLALYLARETEEGERDPSVIEILERAILRIWAKIQREPTTYVMTREEFAIFNYFQNRFRGNRIAIAARGRYWSSNHS